MKEKNILFIRNIEFGYLAELFLINSVLSIVAIRVFLHLTGYPQLGGGGLHIAHMLWGGLLMLIALFMLLFFLDKTTRFVAAIIGGLGFGTFIDELGKFVTSDNDYFFKPTFAFIYLIFIIIFFSIRWVIKSRPFTKKEYLVNAVEYIQYASTGDLDREKRNTMKKYLVKSGLGKKDIKDFFDLIRILQKTPSEMGLYKKLRTKIEGYYEIVVAKKWFLKLVVAIFVIRAVSVILQVLFYTYFTAFVEDGVTKLPKLNEFVSNISNYNFFDWGSLVSAIAVNVLIIIGLYSLRKSLKSGLVWFRRSTLLSLFVYQFFAFYHDQLLALAGVIGDILLYYVLNYIISKQKGNNNLNNK
ncbi:hypothetical protein ACFL0F_01150 [Patescibacteria group bacterium]